MTGPLRALSGEVDALLTSDLVDYCSRPRCGREFRKAGGRGRRQAYCSETCRRTAQNEVRTLQAKVSHYEDLLVRLRAELAVFGRDQADDADAAAEGGAETLELARQAVSRAAGILSFTRDYPDPMAGELRLLHDAVAPAVARR